MIDVYKFLKNYTKVEIIYTNTAGKQYTYYTEIKEVLDDKILMTYPAGINEFKVSSDYTKLTAVFCTEDGVLSGNINLVKADIDKGTILVSFPYNNQFCQRRENTRVPMHVDVEITVNDTVFYLKSKNISGKGVACLTDEPLPDFNDARIVIHMPTKNIITVCKKVYSKEIDLEDSKTILNGIMLTGIKDEDVNIIVKDSMKFQLESKHNERLFETL